MYNFFANIFGQFLKKQDFTDNILAKTRRLIFTFIFLFIASFSVSAFSFEINPNIGVITGKVEEYVYDGKNVLSRLDWKDYGVIIGEVNGKVSWRNLFIGAGVSAGLPVMSGIMEDFDFLTYTKNPTNYSKHELHVEHKFDFSGKLGVRFDVWKFSVSPSIGLTFRTQKWIAKNGFRQYYVGWDYKPPLPATELTWNEPKVYNDYAGKNVISYLQQIFLLSLGINTEFDFNRNVSLSLGGAFYPYLHVEAIDEHLIRNIQFYDIMDGGMGFSGNIGFRYKRFVAGLKYEYYATEKGITKDGSIGASASNMRTNGALPKTTSSFFTVTFGVKF